MSNVAKALEAAALETLEHHGCEKYLCASHPDCGSHKQSVEFICERAVNSTRAAVLAFLRAMPDEVRDGNRKVCDLVPSRIVAAIEEEVGE